MRVVVVGSLNIDYIAAVEHLPAAGETVPATGLVQHFGGADILTAIRYANCAGALATLTPGAQESIPGKVLTEEAVKRLKL